MKYPARDCKNCDNYYVNRNNVGICSRKSIHVDLNDNSPCSSFTNRDEVIKKDICDVLEIVVNEIRAIERHIWE